VHHGTTLVAAADTDIRSQIQAIPSPGGDFPLDAINAAIGKTGLVVEEILSMSYGGQQTFLALSLLYDDACWGTMQFHQDHLVARSLFKPRELSQQDRKSWLEQRDRLGNLSLLLSHENIGKQDMPIADWLASREPGFLKRHLIPEDRALWKFERFPELLKAREALIQNRLKALLVASDR
jgi:hypothetical protein